MDISSEKAVKMHWLGVAKVWPLGVSVINTKRELIGHLSICRLVKKNRDPSVSNLLADQLHAAQSFIDWHCQQLRRYGVDW